MTIAGDITAERAALVGALVSAGASAHAGCGPWTALDLASHLAAQERAGGVSAFIARSLVVRGVTVPAPPRLVDFAIRREYRYGFTALIDRLRRPVPALLLRPQVAPLTLFEYWTHHDDLIAAHETGHAAPPALVQAVPILLRYQLKNLPAAVRVTVRTEGLQSSVGPASGPAVTVHGTPANVVRWLAGRRAARIDIQGADAHVQAVREFDGRI